MALGKMGGALRHRPEACAGALKGSLIRVLERSIAVGLVIALAACGPVRPSTQILAAMGAHGVPKSIGEIDLRSATALAAGNAGVDAVFDASSDVLSMNGYDSYYRVYRINPSQGTLKFIVTADCTCVSFDKRLMVPMLMVLSDAGKTIAAPDARYSFVQTKGFTQWQMKLRVLVPAAGVRYVVVATNNSRPDAVVQGLDMGDGAHLDIRNYPIGKYNVSLQSL